MGAPCCVHYQVLVRPVQTMNTSTFNVNLINGDAQGVLTSIMK